MEHAELKKHVAAEREHVVCSRTLSLCGLKALLDCCGLLAPAEADGMMLCCHPLAAAAAGLCIPAAIA